MPSNPLLGSLAMNRNSAPSINPDTASHSDGTIPAERRFYNPEERLESLQEYGTAAIHRALSGIRPVAIDTDMLQVLEIFRSHQQEHFFPVLDADGRPLGLIREHSLKNYVYSRFGMALLANRGQSRQLEGFLSPCPRAEIDASIEQVLQAAHAVPGTEGVLITHQGYYLGFIRASALVEMAHEQQLEIVRLHNAELDQKSREIQAVLQNMRQGICTILPDLTLHADFSAHLSNILEHDQLAGAALMDALFRQSDLGADSLQQIDAALMAILEQDAFMFDCNAHLLPTELTVTLHGRRKILELHWNPMLNQEDEVSRLMLVVRDITQMRALQQQAEQQGHELQLLSEILAANEARFSAFMDASTNQLNSCQQLLAQPLNDQAIAILYRHLHTIKGNARTLGLMAVTDSLHAAEQILQIARDEHSIVDSAALEQALQQVQQDFDQYHHLYSERLQNFGQQRGGKQISNELWQRFEQLAAQRDDVELRSLLQQVGSHSIGSLLRDLKSRLPALAQELGKPTPSLTIAAEWDNCLLPSEHSQQLSDALVHILRNCLDHGIEQAEQRQAVGKPQAGSIQVDSNSDEQWMRLQVSDDGRGLALQHLYDKAINAGLLRSAEPVSDEQLAELIFHSGLSTAGQVSMISGRGVGMDAVRSSLTELGGSIQVMWTGSRDEAGYRPFTLLIELPRSGSLYGFPLSRE